MYMYSKESSLHSVGHMHKMSLGAELLLLNVFHAVLYLAESEELICGILLKKK